MTAEFWAILAILMLVAGVASLALRRPVRARMLARQRLAARRKRGNGAPKIEQPTPQPVATNGEAKNGANGRQGGLRDLEGLEVSDVMVHRLNMRMVNADQPPETIVREILGSPNTRIPLWRGSIDNIVGVVHAKDLLRALLEDGGGPSQVDIMKVASKPWFVPDTTTAQDQLNAFLRRKSHFAIVVDEYGEVRGLLTLEDIIEEIVGEIADEHDIDVQGVKQEQDGSITVDGSVSIRDLNRALDWTLPDEEATTIAGLVIHETQSIPEEKQAFTFHGKRFVVLKREKNRIVRLRIRPVAASTS